MRILIEQQWRLVRRSFFTWAILSPIVNGLVQARGDHSESSFNMGETRNWGLMLTFLAAAAGARLFSAEAGRASGAYFRALPIDRRRLFGIKLAFGAVVIATGLLFELVCCWTGLEGLVRGVAHPESFELMPSPAEVGSTAGLLLCVYVASVWFTCSLGTHESSTQGCVPGWFASVVLISHLPFGEATLGVPNSALLTPLLVITAAAAAVAWQHRGVVASTGREPLLRSLRGSRLVLPIAAQACVAVLPLLLLRPLENAWPFFGIDANAGLALLCLVAGVAMLPWTLADVRRRALPFPAAAAVIVLCLTGVGVLLWRVARDRGIELRRAGRAPFTPVSWLVILFVGAVAVVAGLGGQRIFHAWEIRASDPDVEIVVDGETLGRGVVRGVRLGRPLNTRNGFYNSMGGTSRRLEQAAEWRLRDVVEEVGAVFDDSVVEFAGRDDAFVPRRLRVQHRHAMFRTVVEVEFVER